MAEVEGGKISFKKSKKRAVRERKPSGSEEDIAVGNQEEEVNMEEFEKTREIQKMRKRAAGTNIVTLAVGKKLSKVGELVAEDPFKLNSGGLVEMKNMKGYKSVENPYEVGTQFSKETHIRDEDDEMRKFIDTEMGRIKGDTEKPSDNEEPTFLLPEDAALLALPKHLTKSTFKKDQQMLSAQMLSGIPEVDLGIDAKIQNIERTEKAKKKLLEENKKKASTTYEDLQKSTNFVQHDRWKDVAEFELSSDKARRGEAWAGSGQQRPGTGQPVRRPNTVNIHDTEDDLFLRSDSSQLKGKASDDAALERFKEATQVAAKANRKK